MARLKRVKLGEKRKSFDDPKKTVVDHPTLHINGKSLGLDKIGEETEVSVKIRLRSISVNDDKKMSYSFDVLEIGDK